MAPSVTGEILDFGCGSKPYEKLFVNASRYIGLDIETSGHDHATSSVDVFYDGKRIPFDDESFDACVTFEVLEHVFNPDEILVELRRVIKTGGKLMLSVPFVWEEHEVPFDFGRYTSFGVKHILEKHGFTVLELRKTTSDFLTLVQLFVNFLSRYVSPRSGLGWKFFQLAIIFPLNTLALALDYLLPRNGSLFCNTVVLAIKH